MATTKAIAEKCKVCNIEIRLLQLRKIELVNQFKPMFPSFPENFKNLQSFLNFLGG